MPKQIVLRDGRMRDFSIPFKRACAGVLTVSGVPGKPLRTKAPKIQRLITPRRLQRKRFRVSLKKKRADKSKSEAADYAKLLAQRAKEEKEKKDEAKRRRSSASKSSAHGSVTPTTSVSEAAAPKKKVGKVPAQAPEVAVKLVGQGGKSDAKKGDSAKVQPSSAKGKEQPKKKGDVVKGKVTKPGTKEGAAGGGAQKKAPPQAAVKDALSKKAIDPKVATEKPTQKSAKPKK